MSWLKRASMRIVRQPPPLATAYYNVDIHGLSNEDESLSCLRSTKTTNCKCQRTAAHGLQRSAAHGLLRLRGGHMGMS